MLNPLNSHGRIVFGLALSAMTCVAMADVVAVVSAKSAVMALNKSQVSDIFLGKASRFPNGIAAVAVDLAEGSSLREAFYTKIAGKSSPQLKAYWSKIIFTGRGQPPQSVPTGIEMKKRLFANPSAIGYIDASMVDASVRVVF